MLYRRLRMLITMLQDKSFIMIIVDSKSSGTLNAARRTSKEFSARVRILSVHMMSARPLGDVKLRQSTLRYHLQAWYSDEVPGRRRSACSVDPVQVFPAATSTSHQ